MTQALRLRSYSSPCRVNIMKVTLSRQSLSSTCS